MSGVLKKPSLVGMRSKYGALAHSLLTLLLFLGFAWCLDLTSFNWWASDGPPVGHPEIYRMRGSFFFGIACGLFLAFVLSLWSLIRRKKRLSGQRE
jgi:TRAP-type C4-dicarboxylate transport system permease small subunit